MDYANNFLAEISVFHVDFFLDSSRRLIPTALAQGFEPAACVSVIDRRF
jgi:hypothetical protein